MSNTQTQHIVHMNEYISPEEFDRLNRLMDLCCRQDGINLKLELDYKLHLYHLADKNSTKPSGKLYELLYYIGEELIAYLGISCFDGVTGELCGMTHPDYREQGIFHRLLALAANECKHLNFQKLLLLADGNSESGMRFLKANTSSFAHSEYRMKRLTATPDTPNHITAQAINPQEKDRTEVASGIIIRLAKEEDEREIARQNAIFFDDKEMDEITGEYKITPLVDQPENYKTYMLELGSSVVGKINVEYNGSYAFICGFGILPEYRRKGYGRQGLQETLKLIEAAGVTVTELDVVCTNSNALGLYQSCGFVEQSVMNYYNLSL
ncbi:MAG: acetyltransferase [Firmicutes bacterium]|nr:acetyltransferase [Bacillota bacterium]